MLPEHPNSAVPKKAVTPRHALLENLIEVVHKHVSEQFLDFTTRVAAALVDGDLGGDVKEVQARIRAGNLLRSGHYGYLSLVKKELEKSLRHEIAELAPGQKAKVVPTAQGLSLVSMEEMDSKVALGSLAKPFEVQYSDALATLNVRLAFLLDRDILRTNQNPFRPEVLLGALQQAWLAFNPDEEAAELLLSLLKPDLFMQLSSMFEELNDTLQRKAAQPGSVDNYKTRKADSHDASSASPARKRKQQAELAHQLRQFFGGAPDAAADPALMIPDLPDIANLKAGSWAQGPAQDFQGGPNNEAAQQAAQAAAKQPLFNFLSQVQQGAMAAPGAVMPGVAAVMPGAMPGMPPVAGAMGGMAGAALAQPIAGGPASAAAGPFMGSPGGQLAGQFSGHAAGYPGQPAVGMAGHAIGPAAGGHAPGSAMGVAMAAGASGLPIAVAPVMAPPIAPAMASAVLSGLPGGVRAYMPHGFAMPGGMAGIAAGNAAVGGQYAGMAAEGPAGVGAYPGAMAPGGLAGAPAGLPVGAAGGGAASAAVGSEGAAGNAGGMAHGAAMQGMPAGWGLYGAGFAVPPVMAQGMAAQHGGGMPASGAPGVTVGFIPASALGGGMAMPAGDLMALLNAQQSALGAGFMASGEGGMPGMAAGFAGMGGMTGPANVFYLPSIKQQAPQGTLSRADESTIDLLSAVFDTVFRDQNISKEIRDLMRFLQIPVLKAALVDKDFFFQEAHPARRLIDLLSRMGWEQRKSPDDPLFQAMQRSVERVGRDHEHEKSVFTEAVNELEASLKADEAAAATAMAAPIAAALKQEKMAEAAKSAKNAVALRIGTGEVVAVVEAFLENRWVNVLTLAYSVEDEKPGAVQNATQTMDDLIWSVKPKISPEERKQLIGKLPKLLTTLNKWLDIIKWQDAERLQFFAELAECHASIVRAPLEVSPERQVELAMEAAQRAAERRRELAAKAAAQQAAEQAAAAAQAQQDDEAVVEVDSLARGDWLEFDQPDGSQRKVKLAWISPLKTLYIFSTHSRQEAFSLSGDVMARKFREGKVRVFRTEGLVGRALSQAMGQAAVNDADIAAPGAAA